VSNHVALIGDAAHGVSPHISVGGALGTVLHALTTTPTQAAAVKTI